MLSETAVVVKTTRSKFLRNIKKIVKYIGQKNARNRHISVDKKYKTKTKVKTRKPQNHRDVGTTSEYPATIA